jgi:hypothetical protein
MEHYPIEYKLETFESKLIARDITDDIADNCLAGIPALQYWIMTANSEGFIPQCNIKDIGHLEISADKIICNIPSDAHISFLSTKYEDFIKRYDIVPEYYNELLDKIPRRIIFNKGANYEIIDTKGILVSSFEDITSFKTRMQVANIQFLMCYFLSILIIGTYNEKLQPLYEKAYILLAQIVDWAVNEYVGKPPGLRGAFRKYLPAETVYGSIEENWYPAYLYSRYEIFDRSAVKSDVPKNYYPKDKTYTKNTDEKESPRSDTSDNIPNQSFNIAESPWFQFDGEKCAPFKPRSKYLK